MVSTEDRRTQFQIMHHQDPVYGHAGAEPGEAHAEEPAPFTSNNARDNAVDGSRADSFSVDKSKDQAGTLDSTPSEDVERSSKLSR